VVKVTPPPTPARCKRPYMLPCQTSTWQANHIAFVHCLSLLYRYPYLKGVLGTVSMHVQLPWTAGFIWQAADEIQVSGLPLPLDQISVLVNPAPCHTIIAIVIAPPHAAKPKSIMPHVLHCVAHAYRGLRCSDRWGAPQAFSLLGPCPCGATAAPEILPCSVFPFCGWHCRAGMPSLG